MLPTIATSVPVAGCSVEAQLLFDRLISQADDQGRLQGEARVVAALCMPLIRTATERAVGRWLAELASADLIIRYSADGRDLIQLCGWWDNQGAPRRAYPSRYPAPDQWEDRVRLDDNPPPTRPQSAGELPAIRRQDGGPRARGSVPPLPVSTQPVPPQDGRAEDDPAFDALTAYHLRPSERMIAYLDRLVERFGQRATADAIATAGLSGPVGILGRAEETLVKGERAAEMAERADEARRNAAKRAPVPKLRPIEPDDNLTPDEIARHIAEYDRQVAEMRA